MKRFVSPHTGPAPLRYLPGAIMLLALALFCAPAPAQRILAVTNTRNAVGAAAGVYVHSLDFGWGKPLPGGIHLPGRTALSPLHLLPDGSAWISSGTGHQVDVAGEVSGAVWHSRVTASPFAPADVPFFDAPNDIAGRLVKLPAPLANVPPHLALLGRTHDAGDAAMGRVMLGGPGGLTGPQWDIPGRPLAIAALAEERFAVLCQPDTAVGLAVCVLDAAQPDPSTHQPLATLGDDLNASTGDVAPSRDGRNLLVLVSGYSLEPPAGRAVSRLYVLRGENGDVLASFDASGLAPTGAPALYPTPGGAWVLTQTPSAEFVHAMALEDNGASFAKTAQYAITGQPVPVPPRLAIHNGDVALCAGERLEIWPGGSRRGRSHSYRQPIGALAWSASGLFVGEGHRVHAADAETGAPRHTMALQSGTVTALTPVPAAQVPQDDRDGDGLSALEEKELGTSSTNPDTDGDGLHDGLDPEPLMPSPALTLPATVRFRGKAVGRQVRVIAVTPEHGKNSRWHVTYDEEEMPWLIMNPRQGVGPGYIYLMVNPALHTAEKAAQGRLHVHMEGVGAAHAAGSPGEVAIRVTASPQGPRRILWLLGTPSGQETSHPYPKQYTGLGQRLSAPPYYCSHKQAATPFQGDLGDYAVVVLSAQAAAQGAVTRQQLLDYVADGGAFLFLGDYLGEATGRSLAHWLQPLGIRIHADTPAAATPGPVPASTVDDAPLSWLARHWDGFSMREGLRITAQERDVLVHGPEDQALLVVRQYGYGRVALLASNAPLRDKAPHGGKTPLFAHDLFGWLLRAGTDIADMDGDGLLDSIEDANDNGRWDPGETDFRRADTDADGIPDSLEDTNLNGTYNDGETNPRDPDTDLDGVLDGADPAPCAVSGAPHVTAIEGGAGPPEGPAEGGTAVAIYGRNFRQDCQIWFGERRAHNVRILSKESAIAVSPPHPDAEGGAVAVRVASPPAEEGAEPLEGRLPKAFTYTPRSVASIRLRATEPVVQAGGQRRGALRIALDLPAGVFAKDLMLLLKTTPFDNFQWREPRRAPNTFNLVPMQLRAIEDGMMMLAPKTGHAGSFYGGPVVVLPWEWTPAGDQPPPAITVEVRGALIKGLNGQPLESHTPPPVTLLKPGN